MPLYTYQVTCTCDEIGDEPCSVHARENYLQDRVNELKSELEMAKNELYLERRAIVFFLRKCSKFESNYASRLLADTMQSKPQADRHEAIAKAFIDVAEKIDNGLHWR